MKYLDTSDIRSEQLDIALYDYHIRCEKEKVNAQLVALDAYISRLHVVYDLLMEATSDLDKQQTMQSIDNLLTICSGIMQETKRLRQNAYYWIEVPSNSQQDTLPEIIFDRHANKHESLLTIANDLGIDYQKVNRIFSSEKSKRYLIRTSRLYRALTAAAIVANVDDDKINRLYGALQRNDIDDFIESGGSFDAYTDDDLLSLLYIGEKSIPIIRLAQSYLDSIKIETIEGVET